MPNYPYTPTPFPGPNDSAFAQQQQQPAGADVTQGRNALNFSLDNPVFALKSAMMRSGINPNNTGDLLAQMLLKTAPGLSLAFQVANALSKGGLSGAGGDEAGAFKDFLGQHLAGGNIYSTLKDTAGKLSDVVSEGRNAAINNSDLMATNPALGGLMDLLGANQGEGLTSALQLLLGPSMSNTTLSGLKTGLNNAYFLGREAYGNQAMPGVNDIWQFLLGLPPPQRNSALQPNDTPNPGQ